MKATACFALIVAQLFFVGVKVPTIAKPTSQRERHGAQHFFCNTGYSLDACLSQLAVLKTVLATLPKESIGEWTWVLVRSRDWKSTTKTLGLSTHSPAFTCLETRTTFIEEALVTRVPERTMELVTYWHMGTTELLNWAVEHEMGHAICRSLSEDKANHVAEELKQKLSISCEARL
jgi:hypothetical protein